MDNKITVRELTAPKEIEYFWAELRAYFSRDMFAPGDEDLSYFTGDEYREAIRQSHDREKNRAYYLFFERAGEVIGFALPVLWDGEDGKCFIMEFCVLPPYRGNGTGQACAGALLDWGRGLGAAYFELNAEGDRRQRFWRSVGFRLNGADEWGLPLLLLPPEDEVPITVEVLTDPADWQLHKLENGFLAEIGEGALTDEKKTRLAEAIRAEKIVFFLAKRGCRAVGMCSVTGCFSTFTCADMAVFDDFFVEPTFRRQGVARLLADAAQDWCRERGFASVVVGCSPGDAGMYRSLGFDVELGTMLSCVLA